MLRRPPALALALILALVLILTPSLASADHHETPTSDRTGFIVGGGLGLGVASIKADLDGASRETRFGVATDITIGYGINSRLLAYAMSRIVWYSLEGDVTFSETAGVGVSYFLSEQVPSLYVAGGLGAAVLVQPAVSESENQVGLGALIGVGYEFSPHWLAEADITVGAPGDFTQAVGLVKVSYLYY